MNKDELLADLSRFRRYRDNLISADAGEIGHHLRDFAAEISRNQLVAAIRKSLPPFNAEAWWEQEVATPAKQRYGRLDSIPFPTDEAERLHVLLDLTESMASAEPNQLTLDGFGTLLGKHKTADIANTAINLVFRPLADLLTERLRDQAQIANPAIRELAGVPLDQIPNDNETKIFLSHKSCDKQLVRPYYELLKELGFDPWLDEHDMKAGDTLHREIAEGFDHSCAVVFFVTENFKDGKWLAREVDHAVHREIELGKRFVIITLVYGDTEVPRSLREKLWKPVSNEVDGVREIIRALPVRAGPTRWRS